jgi:hypothetical protein
VRVAYNCILDVEVTDSSWRQDDPTTTSHVRDVVKLKWPTPGLSRPELDPCVGIGPMRTRFLPYSTRPVRLLAQLFSDVTIAIWTAIWVFVALAVHDAIALIGKAGRQIETGSLGVANNLASAGHGAQHVPLLGNAVSKPITAAADAALDIAGAGHSLHATAGWLSVLLAVAVASPPILAVAMPWLFLRIRFFRRKWVVTALAGTPAGEQLLALRALTNRPPAKLVQISPDPVGAWRHEDFLIIRALAALELRSAGIRVRAR